jgi:ribosome-associated toxin RatA of RatAB toxin-antitoxin module
MNTQRTVATLAALLGLTLVAPLAAAEPDEEATRLMKTREAERYEVKSEHTDIIGGGARIHVAAPASEVKKLVSDFKNYSKFIDKFEKAKVVGRDGKKTDVYLQVPILKGAAKIWAIVRFSPIKSVNGEEVLEGHMLRGNVKRLDAAWRLKKIDDTNTQLSLELVIHPTFPAPGSLVTTEAKRAARGAVIDSRDKAERDSREKKTKK